MSEAPEEVYRSPRSDAVEKTIDQRVAQQVAADGTIIREGDSRLTDARPPTEHGHQAQQVSYAGSAGLQARDVEAALDELDAEKQPAGEVPDHGLFSSDHTDVDTSADRSPGRTLLITPEGKVGTGAQGAVPDATETQKGVARASVAPDPRAGPVFVGTNDPRVRERSGSVVANANVFAGAQAAGAELLSADLRGLWGIPSDAKRVRVQVIGAAAAAGNGYLLLDSADRTPGPFSPHFIYASAQNSGASLTVPLGTTPGNEGRIRGLVGPAPGLSAVFRLYVTGWER